jgi:hypothetical protein
LLAFDRGMATICRRGEPVIGRGEPIAGRGMPVGC